MGNCLNCCKEPVQSAPDQLTQNCNKEGMLLKLIDHKKDKQVNTPRSLQIYMRGKL